MSLTCNLLRTQVKVYMLRGWINAMEIFNVLIPGDNVDLALLSGRYTCLQKTRFTFAQLYLATTQFILVDFGWDMFYEKKRKQRRYILFLRFQISIIEFVDVTTTLIIGIGLSGFWNTIMVFLQVWLEQTHYVLRVHTLLLLVQCFNTMWSGRIPFWFSPPASQYSIHQDQYSPRFYYW